MSNVMPEGITVLSQEVIYTSGGWPLVVFIIATIVISFILIKFDKKGCLGQYNERLGVFYCITIAFLISILFGAIAEKTIKIPTKIYTYTVNIADNVNFNDFWRRYEIISEDRSTNTFVIKEKQI